jgi:hypothetical protein
MKYLIVLSQMHFQMSFHSKLRFYDTGGMENLKWNNGLEEPHETDGQFLQPC